MDRPIPVVIVVMVNAQPRSKARAAAHSTAAPVPNVATGSVSKVRPAHVPRIVTLEAEEAEAPVVVMASVTCSRRSSAHRIVVGTGFATLEKTSSAPKIAVQEAVGAANAMASVTPSLTPYYAPRIVQRVSAEMGSVRPLKTT